MTPARKGTDATRPPRDAATPHSLGPQSLGTQSLGTQSLGTTLAAAALLLALAACHRNAATSTPPGQALKVEMGKSAKLDPDAALRCFVHGQFVGMQTPGACAGKNGVAPGALDVGLDQSGALAAGAGDTPLQPLANATAGDDAGDGNRIADADAAPDDAAPAQAAGDDGGGGIGQVADCLRFGRAGWRDAGRAVTLNACVHAVFDGRCVGPGEAVFGRWGEETLRLIPGRVGISSDNRDFRPLAPQDAQDCSIPTG